MVLILLAGCILGSGCSRGHYRLRADADAYGRILEKSQGTPWSVPNDFSVYPAPHSRLYDPTCLSDPCLPSPAPQLYDYELPALPERDPARFQPKRDMADGQIETITPPVEFLDPGEQIQDAPDEFDELPPLQLQPASHVEPAGGASINPSSDRPVAPVQFTPEPEPLSGSTATFDSLLRTQTEGVNDERSADSVDRDSAQQAPVEAVDEDEAEFDEEAGIQANQVPLPPSYWESIPPECLSRMFAFKSVRDEYARTYGAPPKPSQRDGSPKLTLEDIIDLTLLNSRELQTQKETLYQVALVLTLERFDYQLKPSFNNNGSALGLTHNRFAGNTVNTLSVPTTFQLEKMMYTGADFIGRFANSVLLTFNGPQGFSADVSSDLLFNFSQSYLQRDVRFESLTQSERDVVYAARDFMRFRKALFVQQASDYYSLIRQFRQIEILCQNYFTLAREFNQRSVEIKFGMAARTQLDQVEQQVITGRQSILSSCTSLENALDDLKIRMGIPTEQPLNLDLSELNMLTLRDELAVNSELIQRTRGRIEREIQSETRSAFVILGGVAQLAEQMIDSLRLREQLGEQSLDATPLENRLLNLRIEAADIDIAEDRGILNQELSDEAPDPTKVVQRRRDVSQELLRKILWQIRLLEQRGHDETETEQWIAEYESLGERLEELENSFLQIIFREQAVDSGENPDDLNNAEERLILEAASLQDALQALADMLDDQIGRTAAETDAGFESRAIEFSNELITQSERLRSQSGGGLVPIEIEMDDAMMTALVQRFDLMNQRGDLADNWRLIKYAADDLRSILNLNATQRISTRNGENKPFDFTFDDSQTAIGLTLDLPFNRRAQRNRFRSSLFSYQRTLRNVTQLEDNIKLAVRRDLRALKLNGQQYENDVAGAALASERVTGTELEVRGGFATSRDFLESQQAYVQAISGVASDHVNYIVGRLGLFLDLESLTVGENGFWDELYDEHHQPMPVLQLPGYARPGYGELHPRLKYSAKIRRMECVPDGVSMVHQPSRKSDPIEADSTVEELAPGEIAPEELAPYGIDR